MLRLLKKTPIEFISFIPSLIENLYLPNTNIDIGFTHLIAKIPTRKPLLYIKPFLNLYEGYLLIRNHNAQ